MHEAAIIQNGCLNPIEGARIVFSILSREDFPALADNDFVYLNSGASGPPTYRTIRAMRDADDLCTGRAYLEGVGLFRRQAEVITRAREAAARLVNAGPDDVALTQNTTHGMNLGVAAIDWQKGDEVVSSATEHPGCLMPLHALSRRFGVEVKLVEPPVTVDRVEALLTPSTRLVSLSHVDWTNGAVLPLEAICATAREREIITLVDGAQSVGNIAVDVPATGADMYAFTGHKWVLGPEGMGALYVRPGLPVHSPNVGYLSLPGPSDFDREGGYELRSDARRFEASTMSAALAGGLAEAADGVRERGEEGFQEIRRRAELLIELLSGIPRVTVRSPFPAQSGLVSFEVGDVAAKDAVARLLELGFVLRHVPAESPYIRASTHLFNTEEELEGLTKAARDL